MRRRADAWRWSHAVRDANTVFVLWCRLTGTDIADFTDRSAATSAPGRRSPNLRGTPYEVLLDAGIEAARHGTLPLERWLGAVQTVRPLSA